MKTNCCKSKSIISITSDVHICGNTGCKNYLSPTKLDVPLKSCNQLFMLFLFIFCFIFRFNDYSSGFPSKNKQNNAISMLFSTSLLTPISLKHEIVKIQLVCPDASYAQIMLESGNLSSVLTKRINNLTGMRYPFKRTTTAIGLYLPEYGKIIKGNQKELEKYSKLNNYAVYKNWQDCVQDLKIWQLAAFKLNDLYLNFLADNYAEDQNYAAKIRSVAYNKKTSVIKCSGY